ncbi:DUF2125 domain-containing protein [Rhodobacter maris]|uniref:DUF2125 domain-containing protein n=1 Tax=Rhodobacter maris TaxID=446682 RepID=A0A285S662_9RHOB|nr:DUF2125 domain-containing protein [Rhodobacter maris]SOC02887.1 hypothetical protein SAMN05877831_103249 [Rhodobacter maris]
MRGWIGAGLFVAALGVASWGAGMALERGAVAGFAALSARGQGGLEAAQAVGFPARIGVDLQGVALRDPARGIDWEIPLVEIAAPLWALWSWRADLALPQKLTLGGQSFTLSGAQAQGAMRFGFGADLPLRALGADLQAIRLTHEGAAAPAFALDRATVAVESTDTAGGYHLQAGCTDFALPLGLITGFIPEARFPDQIETFSLDAKLTFAAPLGLLQHRPPPLTGLEIGAAELVWGGHALTATGALAITPEGWPEGSVMLAVSDWDAWLTLAKGAGFVPAGKMPMLSALGQGLARQSADGRVHLPLSFQNGMVFFAGLPLGPAPRIVP